MGDSPAERQRRYRAHRAGDHVFCDPARCNPDTVAPVTSPRDVTAVTLQVKPPPLNAPGRKLWHDLGGDDLRGDAWVLLVEACRITDRLDKLDRLLAGDSDAWLRFSVNEDAGEVTVIIDKAMSEARQQATTLKTLFAELRSARMSILPPAMSADAQPTTPESAGEASNLVDLAAFIARR